MTRRKGVRQASSKAQRSTYIHGIQWAPNQRQYFKWGTRLGQCLSLPSDFHIGAMTYMNMHSQTCKHNSTIQRHILITGTYIRTILQWFNMTFVHTTRNKNLIDSNKKNLKGKRTLNLVWFNLYGCRKSSSRK